MRDAELLARRGEIAANVGPRREEPAANPPVGMLDGPGEQRSHVGQGNRGDALSGLSLPTVHVHIRQVGSDVFFPGSPHRGVLCARRHHEGHHGGAVGRQDHRQPGDLPRRERARARLVVVIKLRDHCVRIAVEKTVLARELERGFEHAQFLLDGRAAQVAPFLKELANRSAARRDGPFGQAGVNVAFHGGVRDVGRVGWEKPQQVAELRSHVMFRSFASTKSFARCVVVVDDPLRSCGARGRVGRINGFPFEAGGDGFGSIAIRAAGRDPSRAARGTCNSRVDDPSSAFESCSHDVSS